MSLCNQRLPFTRFMHVLACIAVLAGCSSGYIARLSPPAPAQYASAVDFAIAYTGGKESLLGAARVGSGHMCGMPVWGGGPAVGSSSRKERFYEGAADICARKGGSWSRPVCSRGMDVLMVAGTDNNSKRVCNAGLEDFFVYAYEPAPGVTAERFTDLMATKDFKSAARLNTEAQARAETDRQEREKAAEARERQRREQAQREAQARDYWLTSAAEFRKSIKVGSVSNCGPVVELRQSLARIYFPVQGYGNEHWLDVGVLFPQGAGCRFVNGTYQPPY